jgi:proteasome activator-like protein
VTDSTGATPDSAPIEPPELLEAAEVLDGDAPQGVDETVDHPAKVMRIGTMMKQLLEEVRAATLDEPSRDRLREIYDTSVTELGSALSPDLRNELSRLALPFGVDDTPSSAELQIAQAQLVGWLEGLVQGMQAMLFAQQMAAQHQLQSLRGELGPGAPEPAPDERPGTYL